MDYRSLPVVSVSGPLLRGLSEDGLPVLIP
jgi:hypothetical protein